MIFPVRTSLRFSRRWYTILPLPLPEVPLVIVIHVTSLRALHPHPSPVVTVIRPSPAAGPTVAALLESVRFPGDPSCVTEKTGGLARPVTIVIAPLLGLTQR